MMIRRKKKLRALDDELTAARREHAKVVREGHAREPLIARLEKRLQENGIAEVVIASLEQTRRRRHP